jgi:oxaloacetate decarboxylase beta subunit
MDIFIQLAQQSGVANLGFGNLVMFVVAGILIYLAIAKEYEPLLLIPIGFGAILANLPLAEMSSEGTSLIGKIYLEGIENTELLPPLIFLGVGVLTDFRPLLGRPLTFLLGAAAQLGIFVAALGAFYLLNFNPQEAASIGIIGGADGPTSIFLTAKLAPHLLGPVAVAAYSYMALVPIIQPPILRLMTTKAERAIDMPQAIPVSQRAAILFPIVTGILASLAVPSSAPLLGMLMFGNLLRENSGSGRRGVFVLHGRWDSVRQDHQPVPEQGKEDQSLHRGGRCVGRANVGPCGSAVRVRRDQREGEPPYAGHGTERSRCNRLSRGGRGFPGDVWVVS